MFFAFPVVLSKRKFSIFCQIITTLLLIISKRGILLAKFGQDLVLFSDQMGRGLAVVLSCFSESQFSLSSTSNLEELEINSGTMTFRCATTSFSECLLTKSANSSICPSILW